jgi:hypothetical protein
MLWCSRLALHFYEGCLIFIAIIPDFLSAAIMPKGTLSANLKVHVNC